jgi:hypothetical protein
MTSFGGNALIKMCPEGPIYVFFSCKLSRKNDGMESKLGELWRAFPAGKNNNNLMNECWGKCAINKNNIGHKIPFFQLLPIPDRFFLHKIGQISLAFLEAASNFGERHPSNIPTIYSSFSLLLIKNFSNLKWPFEYTRKEENLILI